MAQSADVQLSELVNQMKTTIDTHLVPSTEKLRHKFTDEVKYVTDWMHDIKGAITQAKTEMHDAYQNATIALTQTREGIASDRDECLQAARGVTDHIGKLTHDVDQKVVAAQHHGEDLRNKLSFADTTHDTIHEAIAQHLTGFSTDVEHSIASVNDHHTQITDVFHGLEELTHSHSSDVTQKLTAAGEAVANHSATLTQQHQADSEELAHHTQEHLVGNIVPSIGGHVGGFMGDLEGFMSAGDQLSGLFDGHIGDLLGKVDQIGKLIDEIKPVIDIVHEIEC